MDPRERFNDTEEAFRTAVGGLLAGLWTALPCIVVNVNFAAMTVTLQPTIMAQQRNEVGATVNVKLPVLVDVPIVYQGGGGYVATFPIAAGDEALAIFASRCIDSWWQSGGIQTQAELRMHDLSDAFAIIGPRSQPHVITGINPAAAQLRKNDGSSFVEVNSQGVKVHADKVYEWDVHGYGQRLTWVSGTIWHYDNYTIGATVTSTDHPINPPGPLP